MRLPCYNIGMSTLEQYRDEQKSLELLKASVDRFCKEIMEGLTEEEYKNRQDSVRKLCERLFPDKLDLFDMIYQSRFKRLAVQFANDRS